MPIKKQKKKSEKPQTRKQKFDSFVDSYIWYIFGAILIVGLYLRFYNIEAVFAFGWDQGRDAWVVREILDGKFVLIGPRTGIGHMHLAPLYYYLLAPFYWITNFDPSASHYFNFIANIFNFVAIFYVAKKIFGNNAALFVIFVYAVSRYLININLVPWNVTLMPGVASFIFYSIYQIYQEKYKWVFVMWTLSGFYFNLHFTAVFFPIINILSLLFVKDKKKVVWYSLLSIPLYLVWIVPNVIHGIITKGGDSGLIKGFFNDYYIGFYVRFFLHRMHDAFVIFDRILDYSLYKPLAYVIPAVLGGMVLFEKDKKRKLLGYLLSLWVLVPWVGFSLYGGPISEYYFLFTVPAVLFIFVYVQQKLLQIKFLPIFVILVLFWTVYVYQNTYNLWVKPTEGGLQQQRVEVKAAIAEGKVINYTEGDIKAYLYRIWVTDSK